VTVSAPVLDLLAWISARPRTYAETIEAWKTSCPRLSVWDDAVTEGLVRVVADGARGQAVTVTPLGRSLLAAALPER
jgi:hypothetical protein